MKLINIIANMITNMESNKNLQVTNTELLIRGKKIKISDVFISQIYFTLPINKKMHATH